MTAGFAHAEFSAQELEAFDNEPPVIKDLLMRANVLVGDEDDPDGVWKAADMYCKAARYGSAEAVYRLGMLYAFGRGVPENRDYAANLFGIASTHGHYEAQKMLETLEIKTSATPPCVLDDVAPEKGLSGVTLVKETPEIDQYIANLPKNKRWVLRLVNTISKWYKVDEKLVLSIISVESNFENVATSNKEAQGLMQLIPDTAERFNVKNAYNASQNIKGGVAYLRWLLAYYKGDVALTIAAYNAGEGAVNKYKGIPPFAETKQYVKKVQARYPFKTHAYDAQITAPSPALNAINAKRRL
ncbi:lytic transglycosylase domain-containing protein [Methylotenera sp.]|uniref:lytic transglycosylase domain-containing protein n=1 Tax=Methylotenera sp. TaxID=2051956 RepID=UPI0024882679|nr:lytic transglycosylase domain-containing protein [Methylotenera sp.]MDI1362784.1 transglycosylase SLT domain-containing protein [Methylotenera sp.]